MRLRAVGRCAFVVLFTLVWIAESFSVLSGQTTEDEITFRTHYYRDNHGLTVKSPMVIVRKNLSEKTGLSLKYTDETFEFRPKSAGGAGASGDGGGGGEHDHEKSAPQKIFSAVDAVSSASAVRQGDGGGFKEVRKEIVTGLKHRLENTTLGLSYAHSDEDDYRSHAAGLSVSHDFFMNNTNILAAFSHSEDEVSSLNPRSGEVWPQDKDANNFTVVVTQLLSPFSFMRIGGSVSDVDGYQASPYREVVIGGTSQLEVHPDTRLRQSYFFWLNRYFETRTSGHLNGTYYRDDWGVTAQAAELKLYQYLFDPLILRLRYRYYTQTAADFYKPNRTRFEAFMSADPKLRDFDADLYGVKLIYRVWHQPARFLTRIDVELGYDRLEEPQGFHADLGQVAFRMIF